jgi:hypothetical protein
MGNAEDQIQQAELWLRDKAPGALEACEEALAQVAFVEHACTHVLGGPLEDRDRTPCKRFSCHPPYRKNIPAYFAAWTAVNECAVLEGLRRQLAEALGHAARTAVQAQSSPIRKATKGKRIDEKMLATIRDNPEAIYWSSGKWKIHLKCAKSTVVGTQTWKTNCKCARERERLARGYRLRGSGKRSAKTRNDEANG